MHDILYTEDIDENELKEEFHYGNGTIEPREFLLAKDWEFPMLKFTCTGALTAYFAKWEIQGTVY